jgi:hypothetical protein
MLLHESNGYSISHAYVPRARGRSWGWGVGVRVWVSDRADAGPGGIPGLGFADAIRGARQREREGASQVTDGTCAREGVLFTRTSDGRCTNMPGGRVEACGVRTGCRPSVRASFGSALLRAVRRSLLLC